MLLMLSKSLRAGRDRILIEHKSLEHIPPFGSICASGRNCRPWVFLTSFFSSSLYPFGAIGRELTVIAPSSPPAA